MKWVCIATGESLDQADIDLCRDRVKVACASNAAAYAPWADVVLAADHTWWIQYGDDLADFQGVKYCLTDNTPGTAYLESKYKAKIGSGLVCRGGSSGQSTISAIVEHHGATDIALIGYDNKGSHCFGEHRGGLSNPTETNFNRWAEAHALYAEDANANGIRIVNCSRDTTLTCYPRMPLEQWIGATDEAKV